MSAYDDRFYLSKDGLQLFYRDYPNRSAKTPLLCIPGLTRNAKDFDFIAGHIARTRRVLVTDLRGRGRSAYDPDERNYSVPVETRDVLQLLSTLNLPKIVVLGTSRGGVIAMTMASFAPGTVTAAILNDMGAQLEAAGLERIYTVLRSPPSFAGWEDAAQALKRNNERLFPNVSEDRWREFSRALYREDNSRIVGDYDPKFPRAILEGSGTNPRMDSGAADLWKWFAALSGIPTLVLRGENSELLSAETVAEMKARKPDLVTLTVKNRGHVPFLDEGEAVVAIDAFLSGID